MFKAAALIAIIPFLVALSLNLSWMFREVVRTATKEKQVLLVWAVLYLSYALWLKRSAAVEGVTSLDASAGIQVLGMLFAGVMAFLLFFSVQQVSTVFRGGVLLLFIYGFLGLSTAGISPNASLTVYKSALVMLDALVVAVTIGNLRGRTCEVGPYLLGTFILSLFVAGAALGAIFRPEEAILAVRGVFGALLVGTFPYIGANELGFISAVTALVGLRRFFTDKGLLKRFLWGSQAWMGLVVLFLNQSRTSLIGLLLCAAVLGLGIRSMRWMVKVVVLLLFCLTFYYLLSESKLGFEEATEEYLRRGVTNQEIMSLSGRVGLWEHGWEMFSASPVFGHGFEAGVRFSGNEYGLPGGTHMHNAHMQTLINSGLLGYSVWLLMVIIVSRKLIRRMFRHHWKRNDEQSWLHVEMVAILVLILLKTLTGSVLIYHQYSLLIFMGIMAYNETWRRSTQPVHGARAVAAQDKNDGNLHAILARKKSGDLLARKDQ